MFRIFGPKGRVIVRASPLARVRKILPALKRRFGKVRIVNLAPKPKPYTMYDAVTVTNIPASAPAVAGYVGGHWPTFAGLAKSHPHARRLSIAVNAEEDAECLDVEPGDATNAQAPAWVRRQKARGIKRPVIYTSVSNADALLRVLVTSGIKRNDIRLWTAHYTFEPHVCGPGCGFGLGTVADATQFSNKALGRSLDQSLCRRSFWP